MKTITQRNLCRVDTIRRKASKKKKPRSFASVANEWIKAKYNKDEAAGLHSVGPRFASRAGTLQ